MIASANASRNGIGIDGPPGLVEAGITLRPQDPAAVQASAWFDDAWAKAERVDQEALDMATRRFRPGGPGMRRPVRPGSLLDLVAADPDRFSAVSVVIARTSTTEKQRERARDAVAAAHPDMTTEVEAMPANGMFVGWEGRDLDRWSRVFIELWMPRSRLNAYGRRAYFFDDASGTVMSKVRWPAIRGLTGDLPTPEAIAAADADLVRRLLDEHGDTVFTSRELAAAIAELNA